MAVAENTVIPPSRRRGPNVEPRLTALVAALSLRLAQVVIAVVQPASPLAFLLGS
jgi:hypothetical protein